MTAVKTDDNRGYRLLEEALGELAFLLEQDNVIAVSYTHLTLPTILLV